GFAGRDRYECGHDRLGKVRRGPGHGRRRTLRPGRTRSSPRSGRTRLRRTHPHPVRGARRMTTFVLATHNEGKKRELLAILGPVLGADTVVLTAAEAGLSDVAETGVTFAENALIKARAAAAATGRTAIADDSGISVDVLGGAPGIFSARWAGRHGDDRANLELLLAQLSDIGDEHRGAQFRCAAAAVTADG